MNVRFTLTLADFKAAYRLHRRQNLSRQIAFYCWPALTVACIVGVIVSSAMRRMDVFEASVEVGAGALLASVMAPILRYINIRRAYRHLFPSTRTHRSSHIEMNDECIVREIPGMSQLKIPWSGLFGIAQDQSITLLYTNKDCFLMIPAQALSQAQRIELDELFARHVRKGKR